MRRFDNPVLVVHGGGGIADLLREGAIREHGSQNVVRGTVESVGAILHTGLQPQFVVVTQEELSPIAVETVVGWDVRRVMVLVDVAPAPDARLIIIKTNRVDPDHRAIKGALADLKGDQRELRAFCRYLDTPD